MSGWFAVSRAMFSHPIFEGRADRVGVWVWIVGNAAWKRTRLNVNGAMVDVERGQLIVSERKIAEECGVGRQMVRELLATLEATRAITRDTTHGRTAITICNFDKYQAVGNESNPADNPPATQQQPIKETREQDNNSVPSEQTPKASQPAEVIDLRKHAFDTGVSMLVKAGNSERNARTLIAKWCRDFDDGAVLSVLSDCQRAAPVDPVSWITAQMRPREQRSETPRIDVAAYLKEISNAR